MKSVFGLKGITSLMIAFVLILASCKKTDETSFSAQDNQSVANDGTVEAQQDETSDIATSALNTNDPAGRAETDDRTKCATITLGANSTKEAGTITIDFGSNTGCTDSKGNTRKGKLIVSWLGGRWFVLGSSFTVASDGYSINGVKISGTRTVTNVTTNVATPTWKISGSYTSTWPDNTTAIRTVSITRQWVIADSKIIVSQTSDASSFATGTNRYGKSYSVQVTTPLEFSASCLGTSKIYIPVKGVKVITVDTKVYSVDFGTGTCDNTFTVSFNGKSKEFTAKNDSSND